MKFEKLRLKDDFFPVENAIALIREGVIENASIHFEIDSSHALFYTLTGRIVGGDLHKLAAISGSKE